MAASASPAAAEKQQVKADQRPVEGNDKAENPVMPDPEERDHEKADPEPEDGRDRPVLAQQA
jgi:hypothetical protein